MGVADTATSNGVPVKLAGRDWVVKVVPMARVRRLAGVVAQAVNDVQGANVESADGVQAVVDKMLTVPHAVLSLFIDGLPEDIFADEDNGVTFAEFWDVLQIALTLNRVDQLKNVFSRLGR